MPMTPEHPDQTSERALAARYPDLLAGDDASDDPAVIRLLADLDATYSSAEPSSEATTAIA